MFFIGVDIILDKEPALKELCSHIKVSDIQRVKSLAIALEIPDSERTEIFESPYFYKKIEAVFEKWLKSCPKPTRRKIINALKSIEENKAAWDYETAFRDIG